MAKQEFPGTVSKLVWVHQCAQAQGNPAELDASFEWSVLRQAIREAHLFVMDGSVLQDIYNAAVGLVVDPLGHGPDAAPPTLLPFESIFLTTDDAGGESSLTIQIGPLGTEIAGFVLSLSGGVFRAWMILRDSHELTPIWLALRTSGRWHGDDKLSSIVVPQLCDVVNYQPRVTEPLSFAARREWKRAAPAGTFPQPYYVIKTPPLVTQAARGEVQTGRKHASPRYRFDSRSHQRLLVYRGSNPIKESDRAALQARGYEVFEHQVPADWCKAIESRGHEALKPGEWIAVRYTHVRQSVKGAPDLPYVPSIRSVERQS